MSFLSNNPLTAAVKSKIRLWIEYALILAVVLLMGFVAWGKIRTAQLETNVATLDGKLRTAETRVAQVEEVNKAQAEAIATVQQMRTLDSTVLAGLSNALETINSRDASVRTRLALLEKSNEAVRAYLNGTVPDPVGCVLDRTCPDQGKAGGSGSTSASAPVVHRAAARAVKKER